MMDGQTELNDRLTDQMGMVLDFKVQTKKDLVSTATKISHLTETKVDVSTFNDQVAKAKKNKRE
jgi:hypothetical protein